jgi:hypothetical protein
MDTQFGGERRAVLHEPLLEVIRTPAIVPASIPTIRTIPTTQITAPTLLLKWITIFYPITTIKSKKIVNADDAGVNDTNIQEDEILAKFRSRASVDQEFAICQLFYSGHGTNFAAEAQALHDHKLPICFQMVQAPWNALNDKSEYLRLCNTIMKIVAN